MRVFILILPFFLISCSGGNSDSGVAKTGTYSYEFVELKVCTTEYHSFSNQTDYCAALLDDVLNKNCAAKNRQTEFAQNCQ